MNPALEATFRRALLSAVLLIVILMASAAHFSRHMNLGGDEVYFYFLGIKDHIADYRPYYEQVRLQMAEKSSAPEYKTLPPLVADQMRSAAFYLGIEPQFFSEYRLPRLLWGFVSNIVAPAERLKGSDQALSKGLADSVFYMFLAGYFLTALAVVAMTYSVSGRAKIVLIAFVGLMFVKESFLFIDGESLQTFSAPVREFLSSALIERKDYMLFGFTGRSLFLILLVGYLTRRWDRPVKDGPSYTAYLGLPIFTLIHSSQGVLIAGMFLVMDCITDRQRLKHPLVLAGYAGAFGFAVDAGLGSSAGGFAALMSVTVALLLAAATSTALGVSSQWGNSKNFVLAKGACRIDALLLTIFAVGFLLTAQPVAVLLGFQYSPNLGMLGQRLGSMFSVFLPFAFLWLIFDAASKRWKRPVETRLFLAALAVPAVLASIVAATELTFNVTQVRTRLRGHSAAIASAMTRPASFAYNNELHTIWYSIIKSAVHGKDYVVQIQPGVPAE